MIVQVVPAQENAGKIVRAPIAFPWVLDDAEKVVNIVIDRCQEYLGNAPARSDILRLAVVPWNNCTLEMVYCCPYAQSVVVMVNTGGRNPWLR